MKKTIGLASAIVAVLCGSIVVGTRAQAPRSGPWMPYVRNAVTQKLTSTGSLVEQYPVVTARFSDGSYYETTKQNSVWLIDFRKRVRAEYSLLAQMKSTRDLTRGEVDLISHGFPALGGKCEGIGLQSQRQFVGTEVIAGVTAYAYKGKVSDGRTTVTVWFAPDLNCEFVKDVYEHPSGESTVRVSTGIYRGDPDSSLLNVPPNLVETSPQELTAAVVKKWAGLDVPAQSFAGREDRLYQEQHQNR